jgi:hypothetical protein
MPSALTASRSCFDVLLFGAANAGEAMAVVASAKPLASASARTARRRPSVRESHDLPRHAIRGEDFPPRDCTET